MMRRLLACLLLIVLICSTFSRLLIYAGFEANQEYISTTLCINKNKPWMHCNGKCYLMKKVQQAEDNEKKEAAKVHLNNLANTFFQKMDVITFHPLLTAYTIHVSFPEYECSYSSRFINTIFRPPKQVT